MRHDRLLGVRQNHRRLGDRPDHLGRPLDSRRAVPQPAAGQGAASADARRRRSGALPADDDARRRSPGPSRRIPNTNTTSTTASSSAPSPRPFEALLRRLQHPRLPGPLAGPGAMHADGHAFVPGQPDAQAAGAGLGHGIRAGRRVVARSCPTIRRRGKSKRASSAPDDSIPWNYWMNFMCSTTRARTSACGRRASRTTPKAKRHRPFRRRDASRPLCPKRFPSRSWRTSRWAC